MPRYFDNPIKVLHRLREAGASDQIAEAHVEILNDYIEHGLATKRDLNEQEMKFELKLKELEYRLTVKTAAIVGSIVGFFSVLEKLIG